MSRVRRRAIVSVHYLSVAALALLAISGAVTFEVFVMVAAVPAFALYAVDRLVLGGMSMRSSRTMDERQRSWVAAAHHTAHRIAMGLVAALALAALVSGVASGSATWGTTLGIVGIALLVVSASLPAGVLLWCVPEPVA